MPGRWAGSPIAVLYAQVQYNAESPKHGSKRFNYIVKRITIANLGIIYLWSSEGAWAHLWKTLAGAVCSITNIYSLGIVPLYSDIHSSKLCVGVRS